MATRRGAGEGSIYRRSSGQGWEGFIEAGRHPGTGKRQRIKRTGKTKAEVVRKLDQARKDLDAGAIVGSSYSVAAWLEHWMNHVVAQRVEEQTLARYRNLVDRHLTPGLGALPLRKLTVTDVDRFLAAKAASGMSRSHVNRMRMNLADALHHAERRGLVVRNVAKLSALPKCKAAIERRSFTPGEVRSLREAAEGHRLEAMLTVGITLGLRPGELTGLLWSDLKLDAAPATLAITGSMKRRPDTTLYRGPVKRSRAGERTLALTASLADALRQHRAAQAIERLKIGELWRDHGLIFCSELGTPLDPSNVARTFTRWKKRAGIDPKASPPYLMRHTAASLLIDAGATVEEVADLLGDDPATLHRHYRHRVRPVVTVAAERMDVILSGA